MLTVGFVVEILTLFNKMKGRKVVRGWKGGKRRKNTPHSKIEREKKSWNILLIIKG